MLCLTISQMLFQNSNVEHFFKRKQVNLEQNLNFFLAAKYNVCQELL